MTATLSYDLTDPDDVRAHLCAVHSEELAMAIWNITYELRKEIEVIIDSLLLEPEVVERYNPADRIWQKIAEKLPDLNIDNLIS